MSIIDSITSVLAPHTCLGCGYIGALICVQCQGTFEKIPSRCYKCRRLTPDFQTCHSCQPATPLHSARAVTTYGELSKQLVWRLKFDGAQEAATSIANSMLSLIVKEDDAFLVPIPTATSRAHQRGYDQAKLIAKRLSRRSRLQYVDCLSRSGRTHQVGASRQQRLKQLEHAFNVTNPRSIVGKKVILIDDVITTGATLEAAAIAIKHAGAREINALTFAQA